MNLNNLFDNPRYHNELFDNLLHFNEFRDFNYFFNNFFNLNSHYFHPFDVSRNLHNFLFDYFDWLEFFSVMVDDFYHLDKLGLVYDHRFSDVNLLDYGVFNSFDNGFLNNFSYNFHHLMHNWNLDDFLHFHWDLFDHFYDFFDNHFHGLDDLFSY